ncbi:MAG TPA: hypothetical protein VFS39_15940 [Nitrospira sp.]|nr:hypothetical protein [Nitrospira sp.]
MGIGIGHVRRGGEGGVLQAGGALDGAACARCGGFMVVEWSYDSDVRRCVQCGELVDSVILENRHMKVMARKALEETAVARRGVQERPDGYRAQIRS